MFNWRPLFPETILWSLDSDSRVVQIIFSFVYFVAWLFVIGVVVVLDYAELVGVKQVREERKTSRRDRGREGWKGLCRCSVLTLESFQLYLGRVPICVTIGSQIIAGSQRSANNQ